MLATLAVALAGPAAGGTAAVSTEGKPGDEAPPADTAPAQETKPWIKRWAPVRHTGEIGLGLGVFFPSDRHDFYDPITAPQEPLWAAGADIAVRAAYFPLRFLGIEGEFTAMPTRARNITDDFVFLWGARGHLILQLPYWSVTPILLGGGGALGIRSNDLVFGTDTDPSAHWGGGLKVFVNKWIALRLEARHLMAARAAEQDDITHHAEVLAGISLTLRHKPKPPPPPDPDRDDDGFPNGDDACPDTPGVAPDGCPAKDSDGDGFLDPDDKCPETAGVAPDGCPPPDTDGDGFPDPEDQCPKEPETKNGFEDGDGCPDELPEEVKKFTGIIEGIEFEFRKAEIRDSSKATLDAAIEVLKNYPEIRVEISGHSDNKGTREFNLNLSRERAEAVRDYLVAGGVAADRLETRGAGPDEPIAPNDTEEGRARNRRTEFKVISQATEP